MCQKTIYISCGRFSAFPIGPIGENDSDVQTPSKPIEDTSLSLCLSYYMHIARRHYASVDCHIYISSAVSHTACRKARIVVIHILVVLIDYQRLNIVSRKATYLDQAPSDCIQHRSIVLLLSVPTMSLFTVKIAREVSAQHLERPTTMVVFEHEGGTYFEVDTKSTKLENILITQKATKMEKNCENQRARPLSKVTVFNCMRNTRDEEFWKQLANDIGRKISKTRRQYIMRTGEGQAKTLLIEDRHVEVTLPLTGGIEPMPIKVLLTKPATPLKIEFSDEILTYLARVCTFEAVVNPPKIEPRLKRPIEERFDNKGYPGITMLYDGGHPRIVARRKSSEGKKQHKYFTVEPTDNIDDLRDDAIAFVNFADGEPDDNDSPTEAPTTDIQLETQSPHEALDEANYDNLFSVEPIVGDDSPDPCHNVPHERIEVSSHKPDASAPLIHRLLYASGK